MEPQNTHMRAGNKDEASASARGPERIEQAAEQVRQAAEERVNAAQQSAQDAKQRAAERVRKLSSAVRRIGEHMRIEDQAYIADRAGEASERLDAVASYIADAELSTMLHDAEGFARKRPSLVYGGTFLLGFAAARLLKSGDSASRGASTQVALTPTPQPLPYTSSSTRPQGGRGAPQ